jgi:hypothetical protein
VTGLLLLHGRSQELPAPFRQNPAQVEAHVSGITRSWLAGLAKGLVLAGRHPVDPNVVVLPFYGDVLADLIDARAALPAPDLEALPRSHPAHLDSAVGTAVDDTLAHLVVDAAEQVGLHQRLNRTDPALSEALGKVHAAQEAGEEFAWSDFLRNSATRAALQFLAQKTGTPQWIIERYLRDVAFYLKDDGVRERVLDTVRKGVRLLETQGHTDAVVVGHSLGSVVAFDLIEQGDLPVRLLVTAGSPLGLPAVLRNLPGMPSPPAAPPLVPPSGWAGPAWVNAFDPADVVALVHPLAPVFGGPESVRDEQTHNPDGPHSIQDYLADPDVALPISLSLG